MDSLDKKKERNAPDKIAGDRREDRRYPMKMEVKYKLIRRKRVLETGVGHTQDLSSGGVAFEAERTLPVGHDVELAIDWPMLLHNVTPMGLRVKGKIVRGNRNSVALRTTEHEFHTQASEAKAKDAARDRRPAGGRGSQPAR